MITYLHGDATNPKTNGINFIIHICNDLGGWGQGFVLAISSRWPEPENAYELWYRSGEYFQLGEIQTIPVDTGLFVINMIAQKGVTPDKDGRPPIRYDALEKCLEKVALAAKKQTLPFICRGLAAVSPEDHGRKSSPSLNELWKKKIFPFTYTTLSHNKKALIL